MSILFLAVGPFFLSPGSNDALSDDGGRIADDQGGSEGSQSVADIATAPLRNAISLGVARPSPNCLLNLCEDLLHASGSQPSTFSDRFKVVESGIPTVPVDAQVDVPRPDRRKN